MKTNQSETFVPKAQREVWEWKDAIYQDVKALPFHQAVQVIAEQAAQVARELGFTVVSSPSTHFKVAESHEDYGKR